MRRCRFEVDGEIRDGLVKGDRILDPRRGDRFEFGEVRLRAPVQPRKFLGIGLNYADHIAESGMEAPEFPVFFNKQATCVVGPG
ncbi:MAG: fumarylacetoacetate hydrolase family protein, partial [Solirubrobacterales bacterium]